MSKVKILRNSVHHLVWAGIGLVLFIPNAYAVMGAAAFNYKDSLNAVIGEAYAIVQPLITSIAILSIIISGFQLMFSQGDSDLAGKSKERLMGSVMGLVLIILTAVILHEINPCVFTLTGSDISC